MKKNAKIWIGLLVVLLLGAGLYLGRPSQKYINQITSQEKFEEVLAAEGSYIYVSQTDCSHCKVFKPLLSEATNQSKVEVFEYDVQADRSNPKIEENLARLQVLSTPRLLKVTSNGLVDSSLTETSSVEEIKNFLTN